MLRIEEIVGAMDDEFRYALDALGDERLAELAADKAALRRLRPVGVSHAEALAMIAAIQANREDKRRRDAEAEARRLQRAQKRKATPRKKREGVKKTEPPPATPPSPLRARFFTPRLLPAPPQGPLLESPRAEGPAIRLPPPPEASPVIALPPPSIALPLPAAAAQPVPAVAPAAGPVRQKGHGHLFLPLLLLLLLAILALLVG